MVCILGIRGTDLEPKDRTCLETVHSDNLIFEDLDRRTSVACTSACNHPTRNNESLDLLMPSRGRLHTFFDFRFASLYRSLFAVTIRPTALYEDVHASTGHPGYAGMQPMCGSQGLERSNRRCVQFLDMYGHWVRGPPAVS